MRASRTVTARAQFMLSPVFGSRCLGNASGVPHVTCRICTAQTETILDLGSSPPANSLLSTPADHLDSYPLVLEHCATCGNVQLRDCLGAAELYQNYLYVTPDSPQLQAHYERLHADYTARAARVIHQLDGDPVAVEDAEAPDGGGPSARRRVLVGAGVVAFAVVVGIALAYGLGARLRPAGCPCG